jgi:asparagine synthetase B (glutamine-hydrolysing)
MMFLFASGDAAPDIERLAAGFKDFGPVCMHKRGSGLLVCLHDRFTRIAAALDRVVVDIRRPGVDRVPVCSLEWNVTSGAIVVRRRWSGEFTAYYWRQPLIVCSHLRAAALAFGGLPPAPARLKPGWALRASVHTPADLTLIRETRLRKGSRRTRRQTMQAVRRLLCRSVKSHPQPMTMLLSGGIDSSAMAAAAASSGKRVHAVVFSLSRSMRAQRPFESDLWSARRVASHLRVPLTEVRLSRREVVEGVPLAVQLAETARGTIVDECAALVAVARRLHAGGVRRVYVAEAADDLFGGFKFALRLFKGRALARYYRRQMEVDLPDELAILQNVFRAWGISLVDPFWTRALVDVGYNLPLAYRLDRRRVMKTVLRRAFADLLPPEIVWRPKCVTRDATQIRDVLERRYGVSRERYRPILRACLGTTWQW